MEWIKWHVGTGCLFIKVFSISQMKSKLMSISYLSLLNQESVNTQCNTQPKVRSLICPNIDREAECVNRIQIPLLIPSISG